MNRLRRLLHQLWHDASRMTLAPGEHASGRQLLIELMAKTPVRPGDSGVPPVPQGLRQARWFRPALVSLSLVALVGAGTMTAAEQALPGDPLYDIKINVTEELRSWLAVGPEARAQLAVNRSQRRLEETAQLAVTQRLDEHLRERVEGRLHRQSQQTEDELKRLQVRGNAEAAARLGSRYQAVLEANERLFTSIDTAVQAQAAGSPMPLDFVIDCLRTHGAAAAQARGDAEAVVADASREHARAAADRERTSAGQAVATLRRQLDHRRPRLATAAVARTEAELQRALQAIDDAEETYAAGAYGAAFGRFQAADRTATAAGVWLRAQAQLRVHLPLPVSAPAASPAKKNQPNGAKRGGAVEADVDAESGGKLKLDVPGRLPLGD